MFYVVLGFAVWREVVGEVVGRRTKYYNNGSDALLMDRGISPA